MTAVYAFLTAAFASTLFLALLSFMVHATKSLCFGISDQKKKNKSSMTIRILCLFSIGLMCVCMFVCIFIAIAPIYFVDHQRLILFISYCVFNIGMGFVISFFLHSLYITSKATTYGYSSCFLWSIQIFQCLFVIWKILHHLYALLVDWGVNYIVSELYVAIQLVIHILLLFLFNRILYFVARESFAYSHAENLKKHKGVNRLLNVAVKYTVLVWYACMYICGCVFNRIF